MRLSAEDFFMYLIIALIIVVPLVARVYRYLTAKRAKEMLRMPPAESARTEKRETPDTR